MYTYVMSDLHGCYKDFCTMLDKISFSGSDNLILAGDYIDRGKQSLEMLQWMEHCPENVLLLRGNHEEEFASYVDLMLQLDRKEGLGTDFVSNVETLVLYNSMKYYMKKSRRPIYFDYYGTIGDLLERSGVTLEDLCRWAKLIRRLPYYHELTIGDRACIVVHAGYAERLEDIAISYSSLEDFYLYAREEGVRLGGKHHGMVVAGHTPTIIEGRLFYHKGEVFRYYDKEKDCIFYDIDCGCVFRGWQKGAKLACLRLEDEEIFYV